jgi:DnaJ-class molecular chaperone
MDKLLDPNEVKKFYRKATMLCHPDKIRNCEDDPDKTYIANRCFAAITEAYNIFKVKKILILFDFFFFYSIY